MSYFSLLQHVFLQCGLQPSETPLLISLFPLPLPTTLCLLFSSPLSDFPILLSDASSLPASSPNFLKVFQWNAESLRARSAEFFYFVCIFCQSYLYSGIQPHLFYQDPGCGNVIFVREDLSYFELSNFLYFLTLTWRVQHFSKKLFTL